MKRARKRSSAASADKENAAPNIKAKRPFKRCKVRVLPPPPRRWLSPSLYSQEAAGVSVFDTCAPSLQDEGALAVKNRAGVTAVPVTTSQCSLLSLGGGCMSSLFVNPFESAHRTRVLRHPAVLGYAAGCPACLVQTNTAMPHRVNPAKGSAVPVRGGEPLAVQRALGQGSYGRVVQVCATRAGEQHGPAMALKVQPCVAAHYSSTAAHAAQ